MKILVLYANDKRYHASQGEERTDQKLAIWEERRGLNIYPLTWDDVICDIVVLNLFYLTY